MSDLKTQTAPAAADTGLPLFYSRPEALNPIRHGSLGLTARADFSFARSAHAIPWWPRKCRRQCAPIRSSSSASPRRR
ncbi:hypothetical protein RFN25_14325 [Mesorhizobium abyssinicae]|uniref:hypothetical protein n=1 Tax=Mesorhizobium abyssinicae TaxID=1209958 RepID=UPI002A23BFDE|nr:hypothetical protein [Mesorhizobium abyssinicae]MDX8434604.1 hypothetical protein [Mesorhizobium abyssinicae]